MANDENLKVMSFNMHGFCQGYPIIDNMIQQVGKSKKHYKYACIKLNDYCFSVLPVACGFYVHIQIITRTVSPGLLTAAHGCRQKQLCIKL